MLPNEKSIECSLTLLRLCHACKVARDAADSRAAEMSPGSELLGNADAFLECSVAGIFSWEGAIVGGASRTWS